jgi:hypothetical protein
MVRCRGRKRASPVSYLHHAGVEMAWMARSRARDALVVPLGNKVLIRLRYHCAALRLRTSHLVALAWSRSLALDRGWLREANPMLLLNSAARLRP